MSAIGNTQNNDEQYGEIIVPRSPLSLFNSAAGNFGGAYLESKADTEEANLKTEKMAEALAKWKDIYSETENKVTAEDMYFDADQQTTVLPEHSGKFEPKYSLPVQREMLRQMMLGDNEISAKYGEIGLAEADHLERVQADAAKVAESRRQFEETLNQKNKQMAEEQRQFNAKQSLKEQKNQNTSEGNAALSGKSVTDAINNLLNNPVYNEKGDLERDKNGNQINQRSLITEDSTGVTGQLMSFVGGTDSFKIKSYIDTIKSNLGFDALATMREASRTGGALGNVTVKEIEMLQNSIANLNIGLDDKTLIRNIRSVENHYNKIISNLEMIELEDLRKRAGE